MIYLLWTWVLLRHLFTDILLIIITDIFALLLVLFKSIIINFCHLCLAWRFEVKDKCMVHEHWCWCELHCCEVGGGGVCVWGRGVVVCMGCICDGKVCVSIFFSWLVQWCTVVEVYVYLIWLILYGNFMLVLIIISCLMSSIFYTYLM